MSAGKLQPQAIDIEKVVLGALMIDKYALETAVDIFRDSKVFYKSEHQLVFNAARDIYRRSDPVDLLTLSQELRSNGNLEKIGGDHYLVQLSQMISSTAHIEYHCRIIQQTYIKRKSIQAGSRIIEQGYDESADVFDTLGDTYSELNALVSEVSRKKAVDFSSQVNDVYDSFEEVGEGLLSTLSKLNKQMNGYRGPDLIILAARPGMGKTALMLNEALTQAMSGIPVAIFSLEMSAKQLILRMLARFCNISAKRLRDNALEGYEWDLLTIKKHEFAQLPIHIHDQPAVTPLEIKIQLSRWIREKGVKSCYVDYLQLMRPDGNQKGNRESEISSISRDLKGIAMEFDIPVMALSQLSRAVETRGGSKRPLLSDLRESGAIEQDADIVMFIYRPEYYKLKTWDDDEQGSTLNQAEILCAKFREGSTFAARVGCDLEYMKFYDL